MSETPKRGRSLAPVAHSRWRVPRCAGWLALAGVLGLELATCRTPELDCATVARTGNDAQIILACEREYLRTGDPQTGARLADAHRLAGNLPVARAIANALLVTPVRGDALRVLGQIAKREARYDDALEVLDKAHDRHREIADHEGLARDDQAIASVQSLRHNQPAALRALDECITESRAAGHTALAAYCHLSAARVMTQSGAYDSARNEYDTAQQLFHAAAESARDLAWLDFERGKLEQDARRVPRAPRRFQLERQSFESAIARARAAQLPGVAAAAELNLAWSLSDAGALDDAARHLAIADELDDREAADPRHMLHAELAYRRGQLAEARAIYDRIYDQLAVDDQIDVAVMQARIALAQGDTARAEQWAARGVEHAHRIRLVQPEVELRQWALSNRRLPYELMFVARARAGRIDDAMATLAEWQGQAELDALSRPAPDEPPDVRGVATRIDQLRSWLPAIGSAPRLQLQPGAPADARAHDLLALFVADDHLWRVASGRGGLAITDLGAMASFEDDLRVLRDRPTDAEVAARLGARLVPDHLARPSRDSLRVVLDAALGGLPVAALRVHGQPVISARSIVYATSVSRLACQPPAPRPRPVVILGDAAGDLPGAASEARALARALHVDPALGPALGGAATARALEAAGPGSLLHVAVHGDIDASGGFLALADRRLHALEILDRQRAPELVVLSACVSALSTGRELADSLAAAFLAAGATQVVATLRTVPDDAAHDLMARFYAAGGADDPARALARVQRGLVDAGDQSWASFAVFGQDLCVTGSAPPIRSVP